MTDSERATPSHRATTVTVARPELKFSCAHMTVFPDGRKERMHGHNFMLRVGIELRDPSFAQMVDFAPIKAAARELCAEWKEHLLLASENPLFELIRDDGDEIEFRLAGDRYLLPRRDVLLLPVDNIAVEALAAYAAELLAERLAPTLANRALGLEVGIDESPGQGATAYRSLAI